MDQLSSSLWINLDSDQRRVVSNVPVYLVPLAQVGEEAQRNCPGSWIIGDPLPLDCLLVGGIPAVAVDPNVLLSCRLGSWRGQVLGQGPRAAIKIATVISHHAWVPALHRLPPPDVVQLEENARLHLVSNISIGELSTLPKHILLKFRVTLEQGLVWVRSSWALFMHSKELVHTDSIVSIQVTLTMQV